MKVPTHILCVCTGNTCRSPMAEALLRAKAAARGLPLTVHSAGISAFPGDTATDLAVEVLRERGIDLSGHRATPLTRYACDAADRIIVMTEGHRQVLLSAGIAADKLTVLGVPDPFGGDLETYEQAAEAIDRELEHLLPPFSVVPMQARHVEQLARLEQLCFADPWSEEALEDELHNDAALFLVAESPEGAVLGYAGCFVAADEASVANVAVTPAARRQGVASWLLEALKRQAAERGAAQLFLEVRASNEAAQALYASSGFEPCGRRPQFYREPTEDALLYRAVLGEGESL